jgi:hypothetical protein
MSRITRFLIKWSGGKETEHPSSDCHTPDALANSMFGHENASALLEAHGHEISVISSEPAEGGTENGEEQQQSQESGAEQGAVGSTADAGGAATA